MLIEELAKLPPPPPNAYLPTNPDVRVHGIIPEKGVSLQSAAKAPIMVGFECHPRETDSVKEFVVPADSILPGDVIIEENVKFGKEENDSGSEEDPNKKSNEETRVRNCSCCSLLVSQSGTKSLEWRICAIVYLQRRR